MELRRPSLIRCRRSGIAYRGNGEEKAGEAGDQAHSLFLTGNARSRLESICTRSPCVRRGTGQMLYASGHVSLIGKAQFSRNRCERCRCVLDRSQSSASTNACSKCFRRNTEDLSKPTRYGPRRKIVFLSPFRELQRGTLHQSHC